MPPSAPSKTQSATPFPSKTGIFGDLARPLSGKAAPVPAIKHYLTPSEFSGVLAGFGIGLCEKLIRQRCNLKDSDPRHIATHPAYPGRHYIPRAEAYRLAGITEASA